MAQGRARSWSRRPSPEPCTRRYPLHKGCSSPSRTNEPRLSNKRTLRGSCPVRSASLTVVTLPRPDRHRGRLYSFPPFPRCHRRLLYNSSFAACRSARNYAYDSGDTIPRCPRRYVASRLAARASLTRRGSGPSGRPMRRGRRLTRGKLPSRLLGRPRTDSPAGR